MRFQQIASRVFNTPLIIDPRKVAVVLGALAGRFNIASLHSPSQAQTYNRAELESLAASMLDEGEPERRAGKVFHQMGQIAVIPVYGTLVQKNGLDPFSGMTGYDGIGAKLRAAVQDPSIKAILLDVDSPGGEVSGCFDLCDEIFKARQSKHIVAVCDEMACSAAYAIASSAHRVVAPRTGVVANIGVITLHADYHKALEAAGIAVTLIFAGDHKADGNPYESLPKQVLADIQAEIDAIYDIFVSTVARNRGLSKADVIATQARAYLSPDALELGLIDDVLSARDGWHELVEKVSGNPGMSGGAALVNGNGKEKTSMAEKKATAAARKTAEDTNENEPEKDPAPAPATEPAKDEPTEPANDGDETAAAARARGAKEERIRIAAIVRSAEAKGREPAALAAALDTNMTAPEAKALLAATPAQSGGRLAAAMENVQQPKVGPGNDGSEASDDDKAASKILSAHQKATGRKPSPQPNS